ncbi:apoptosis facilitator Bcl-2-like protein 14 [Dunckerocampus dactyliophorus]|uniref:apoptosis facilitator Bcl-2-like protein 14 n=1 Tax=Dunckerocampus dactyliophorus TaxID=161453 RepID=UPI0024072855|nr:apoptosis facilitator Bcl-2-like protein 14 [Dunckerocampus dactyliophorus]
MANGRIEIHDPFANGNNLSSSSSSSGAAADSREATSDAENLRNIVEFRLMMAYAKRRRRRKCSESSLEGSLEAQMGCLDSGDKSEEEKASTKKKKRRWKRLTSILRCIKPETGEARRAPERGGDFICAQGPADRHIIINQGPADVPSGDVEGADEIDKVACRLTDIADDIPFAPPEVELDSPEEDANVEKLIGLLLRECGDSLDQKVTNELRDALTAMELFWNYGFFERLIQTVLMRLGLFNPDPEAPGPQTSPKTQIAVACEVTSRLSAADTLPVNRLMGYGATYLQNHFSSWAKQQGGYEAAFSCEEDDDDDDDGDDVQ